MAAGQGIYKVYEIGPSGSDLSISGINNSNQVIGYVTQGTGKYFVGTRLGGYTFLNPPNGFVISGVNGISDSGYIAGVLYANSRAEGCVWNPSRVPTATGKLPGFDVSATYGVDSQGNGCGAAFQNSTGLGPAVRWSPTTGLVMMTNLNGFSHGEGRTILDDGTVYGTAMTPGTSETRAVRWSPAGMPFPLNPVAGFTYSNLALANRAGLGVGTSRSSNAQCPTKWIADQPVELPRVANDAFGAAFGVDSFGNVVGVSYDGITATPCYWKPDGTLTNLNTRIDPSTPGWTLQYASIINDNGVIVGVGNHNGRENVYFIAEPVAESHVAPRDVTVNLGYIQLGDFHSLSAMDGDTLRLARAFVPNFPPRVQFSVTTYDPYASLSSVRFATISRCSNAGTFQQSLEMHNFVTGDYDTTDVDVSAIGQYLQASEVAGTGNAGRYRRNDGLMRARVTMSQTGFASTASWALVCDMVEWKVVP